ncbi:GreA/GreB family elongation factor [Alkalihalobacterium elongatum]|uniref:GreA/GreB family elongation factor n=1 Tax=Alkalihalobacterium elongatum TaxID=2675466 RepID=UPI001C1F9E52|nr:GreA/GreB family elongation factor [Alkalihalobacterium elongatum]
MSENLALIAARSKLINQLVYFDEELNQFLDLFVPDRQKRSAVKSRISEYSMAVEEQLNNFSEESLSSVVLIGSKIDLLYLDEKIIDTFTIVFPYQANLEQDLISFLSPIGLQLLLAKLNSKFTLLLPNGETEVVVKKISFVNSGLVG